MNNGIKPTRLYRLTGRKHCRRLIQGREQANPPHNQRHKSEVLQLMGMIIASVAGLGYSFGLFSPPPDATTVMRPPPPCRAKKRKVNQDKKNPCPPEEPPELPKCGGPDECVDDRKGCKYKV